jgi:hypothetical protein
MVGVRAFAVALVLLGGTACAGPEASISGPTPGQANHQPVVEIPLPGSGRVAPAPDLPQRGPAMPQDTIPLEELYRQGRTDVLR